MERDSGVRLEVLKMDGGVTAHDLAMPLRADILGVPVSRPVVAETNWHESRRWPPSWTQDRCSAGYAGWRKARAPLPRGRAGRSQSREPRSAGENATSAEVGPAA